MNERRKRILKRLVVEELERREMLTDFVAMTNNSLELTSLPFETDDSEPAGDDSAAPEATSGVGQQTITTGANTPGISSFATPTAGPSRAGGTGNPNLPMGDDLAALDKALEELLVEFDDPLNAEAKGKLAPADDGEPAASAPLMVASKPSPPTAWSVAADASNEDAAGAER